MSRSASIAWFFRLIRLPLRGAGQMPHQQDAIGPPRRIGLARPMIRTLEPRLVLNASAEIGLLGDLIVTGTDAAETVRLDVDVDGNLQLYDGNNDIIPIANHPGDSFDPLDPDTLTARLIRFDLAGGDDELLLELPANLDISVASGDGMDSTAITEVHASDDRNRSIDISSETIDFASAVRVFDFTDDLLTLQGDVSIGQTGQQTSLDVASQTLQVDGRLIVAGDVSLLSNGAIDFQNATVSASDTGASLRFVLGNASLDLSGSDNAGGHLVEDLVIAGGSDVRLGDGIDADTLSIDGDLEIRDVAGDLRVEAVLNADDITIAVDGDVDISQSMTASGDIEIVAGGSLRAEADLLSLDPIDVGNITLSATDITLVDLEIRTAGGEIHVSGPTAIDGDVGIDSGNQSTVDNAGRIEFLDGITGSDGLSNTLRIDATGQVAGGAVFLRGDVGQTDQSPLQKDLNSIAIDAGQVETRSVGIRGGDLRLTADTVRLLGDQYETRGTGDIAIDGNLRLPSGDSRLVSAGDVGLIGPVIGQAVSVGPGATGTFRVVAEGDVTLAASLVGVANAIVDAGDTVTIDGPVSVRDDIQVSGDIAYVNATLDAASGDVLLTSQTLLSIQHHAVVSAGGGSIVAIGGGGQIDTSGGTLQSDQITLRQASDVTLGDVDASGGSLTLGVANDVTGDIRQAGSTIIEADQLWVRNGGVVDLSNSGNNFTRVEEVRSSGPVTIVDSVDAIELVDVESLNQNIQVVASGDLWVGRIDAGSLGDVVLMSNDDILGTPANTLNWVTANQLTLVATNEQFDGGGDDGIRLATNVDQVQAVVMGNHRGDIVIHESDSILLARTDNSNGAAMQTTNGQIVVHAMDAIEITDSMPGDDPESRKNDAEIRARGEEFGRIELVAGQRFEMGDDVQLKADKVTAADPVPQTQTSEDSALLSNLPVSDRAVYIRADEVVLGQRIEIDTGPQQGVARVFAPRPIDPSDSDAGLIDGGMPSPFAFYDPTSIAVNVLEQAVVNDATGILSLNVGQVGEQGLTIDIDWGAANDRFQRIDGLSSNQDVFAGVDSVGNVLPNPVAGPGAGNLTIEHFYTEADILDSTFNGRTAATEPLNVKFAVRHHESIWIEGETIRQDGFTDGTADRSMLISSTDDPATAALESGQVSFIIPSLTIPVAFFPVRNVIPEFDVPEIVVRNEVSLVVAQTSVETVESTTVSSVSRDEYFQLRVLSPDPNGEDLVEPKKLPDNILDGDKIQELFARLPDGAYEIEYVLGDGNERTILKVDVRNGEATIPEGDLDEGELRLKFQPTGDGQIDGDGQPDGDQDADDQARWDASRSDDRWAAAVKHIAVTEADHAGGDAEFESSAGVALAGGGATGMLFRRRMIRTSNQTPNRLGRAARFLSSRVQ
ncbi:hypothetical protein K227x_15380 [Rubripirellula lacrimiformis]|uniref:Uncharacterized protein n=1 Tax=Rubripirellula lacrimiformis TaxID=1930273 RepID=A0A517N7P1_9BACT|nr:hypothetical protein [Rubripirellula lacrimiformis]QDT03156.1 hypothetical protein K227x_15380 [Rubripirellula lacrimiformis]